MHTEIKQAWAAGELVQYRISIGYPWEDWGHGECLDLPTAQFWRVAPKTININGRSVPAPLRSFDGVCEHWIADLGGPWRAAHKSSRLLSLGLCHTTREAAQAHLDALLSFTRTDA